MKKYATHDRTLKRTGCVRAAVLLFALVGLVGCVAEPGAIGEPSGRGGVGGLAATAPPTRPTPQPLDASPEPAQTVLSAAGKGTSTTKSFRVDDSWSLGWQHGGRGLFSIQLIPAGIQSYGDLVLSIVGPAKGSQPMYRAGFFVLRIVATGTWRATVVDVAAWRPQTLPFVVTGSGTANTVVFRVDGPWFVEWWQPGNSPFHVDAVSVDGDGSWELANVSGAAGSCAARQPSGRFYLRIVADGSWRLRISGWDGVELVCPV